MKAFKLLLLVTLTVLSSNIVSAENVPGGYHTPYYNLNDGKSTLHIKYGMFGIDYLHSHIYKQVDGKNVLDTNETYLMKNPDGSYTFKNISYAKASYDGKLIINDSTVYFENNNNPNIALLSGSWDMYNSTVDCSGGKLYISSSNQGNFSDVKIVGLNSFVITQPTFQRIENISIYNSTDGLRIQDMTDGIVKDIYIENMSQISFYATNFTNVTFSNITIERGGNYTFPKTFVAFALGGLGGHDNHVYNIYINGSAWSALDATDDEYNSSFNNVEIHHAGHNGIDLHCQHNFTVNNASVYDSVSENMLIVGRSIGYYSPYGPMDENKTTHDIYIYNYNSYNATGAAIAGRYINNLTVVNLTSPTIDGKSGGGLAMYSIRNMTIINATIESPTAFNFGTSGTDGLLVNPKTIDCNFSGTGTIFATKNFKIINTIIKRRTFATGHYAEFLNGSYVDIKVVDGNRTPVPNAEITLTANRSAYPSMDGYGNNQTVFYTDRSGRTLLPSEDRENTPVLADYYLNYPNNTREYTEYSMAINQKELLTGIRADVATWYRKNPNVPTYTITAIIPDDSKGPHLTGFAPRRENPFNPGEKKNFRVWTDEPLTTMEWYVDGSDLPVSKGSLNYAWPVTEGKHTIKFVGSNANGNVNHTWDLGGSSDEPSVPDDDPTQEIKFSPAEAALTRNVSEKTVFSVSPDIFTTKEWYINGDQVLNNTASMTRCWDAAGTYKVTFSGSGSGGTVSNTWAVNVFEEPKEEEQNRSEIMIAPEYQIITPKQSFSLNIIADPSTPITGAQLDFILDSSMVSANGATEGNLFKQNGAQTLFSGGTIDKSAGKIKNIYGFVIGTSNVSSPGTMATVNLTAGNRTGIAEFSLSNVIISNTSSKPVPITIKNATVLIDTAPVMNQICCPKSVNEKSTLTFKVSARDADGDRLILSASGLPQGAVFNTTSGTFTWTPERGQAGTYIFTFKVSDGYLTDSENVTVTVNKLNNLPVINFFEPLNGAFFSEGEKINISVNASDADRQALNYSIRIDGVEYSTGPAYVWETGYSSSGNRTIEVAVSDGIDEVKEQHTIFINNYHPRWDVNEDGIVNILDITIIAQNYGSETKKPYPRWDINQDGVINIQDLTLAGYYFGEIVI